MTKKQFCFIVLFLAICIVFADTIFAATFDQVLDKAAALRKNKKYAELAALVVKSKASAELEDLRLFLLAEGLKESGEKEAALKTFERLLERFPDRESANLARFPHILLTLEKASEASLSRIEGLARALPTAWQRGTVFEKLSALSFLKPGKKSRFSLTSIREFNSGKPFYKSVPESHGVIKKVLTTPANYVFEADEWLEIIVLAAEEGLIKTLLTQKNSLYSVLSKSAGAGYAEVFYALSLFQQGKKDDAVRILSKLISAPKTRALVKAFAQQERAYIFYQERDYSAAINDYRRALESPRFPVNVRACQYRLMRSFFMASRDSECLEMLKKMLKEENPEPLLPVHIYEMGLERFDAGKSQNSVPFFMLLSQNFPGHYRADDAIGYAVLASGRNSEDGKALLKLLQVKYGNSFFVTWIAPELQKKPLKSKNPAITRLSESTKLRVKAWKKLWDSDFASFAREEARKMTEKYPANMGLYYEIIEICKKNHDYNQLTAYGERLARQLLENGKSLADMPEWGWKAFYPLAFYSLVEAEAKKNKIDPCWVLSIMREESHFNPDTLSRSNAHSLMQILPTTGKWIAQKTGHRHFNKSHLWKPEVNIKFGCWYLKYLSDLFNGDLHLASASYNGGQGNIQRKVENGPFASLAVLERLDKVPLPETRDYYKKVMGSYWNYKRLYK